MIIKAVIEDVRAVVNLIHDIYKFGVKIRQERASKFVGTWGNEGSVTGIKDSHLVEMTLSATGTDVNGTIETSALDGSGTRSGIASFIGKRSGYHVHGQVFTANYRGTTTFGMLHLHLKDDLIELKGNDVIANVLPEAATLWRYTTPKG